MQPLTVDELRAVAFSAWQTLHQEKRDLDAYVLAARCVIAAADHLATGTSGDSRQGYLTFVRNMTFNISSACWPGWEDAHEAISPEHLAMALMLCRRNLELADTLNSPPAQRANGYWMLGAHLLANHLYDDAIEAFESAREAGRQADSKEGALMAEGWIVAARILGGDDCHEELDRLVEQLKRLGEDGDFYASQYGPALQRLA